MPYKLKKTAVYNTVFLFNYFTGFCAEEFILDENLPLLPISAVIAVYTASQLYQCQDPI